MKYIFYINMLFCLSSVSLSAQNNTQKTDGDSLSLSSIVNRVISNYPSVKKAEQEIEYANARIGLAKSVYNPNIDLSASYSHIGPTSQISIPEMGTFSLYPADNYSAALNYNQLLYDFGKSEKSVALENLNKELALLSVEQLKQRLSLNLAANYYSLLFLKEAIAIKNQEIANLNEHLLFVKKRAATGSATDYEILTTNVRISNIENQRTDLESSFQIQLSLLNSFLGENQSNNLILKKDIKEEVVLPSVESMTAVALSQREEIRIAKQRSTISELRSKIVDLQNNPAVNLFATGGFKNGYIPNLATPKFNYALGLGFKVPIFDANRKKYSQVQAKAEIKSVSADLDLAQRNIVNEIVEARVNTQANLLKIKQSELQLKQAVKAFSLADVSFKAGSLTNLDLLDAETAVAESQLFLLKSRIDYSLSLLKLKIALGEKIY